MCACTYIQAHHRASRVRAGTTPLGLSVAGAPSSDLAGTTAPASSSAASHMLSSSACDDAAAAAAAPVGDDKPAGGGSQQPAAALEVGETKADENSARNGPPVEAGKAEGEGQQPQPQQVTVVPTVPTTMHQMELFVRIRELVRKAVAAKHTFMIYGRSRVVREALLSRGWCEKYQKKGMDIAWISRRLIAMIVMIES